MRLRRPEVAHGLIPRHMRARGQAQPGRSMNTSPLVTRLVQRVRGTLAAALTLAVLIALPAGAAEIWNGPMVTFTNLAGSDPTLPSSQDRITLDVWLTRGSTRGLYNAALESGYTSLSPVGTEWAYGELANYASLNYQTWATWNGQHPPFMVGQDAVLHIIPDDIYLAIEFTSWNVGGGGFSYLRSTQAVPEPSTSLLLLVGVAAFAGLGRYRLRFILIHIHPPPSLVQWKPRKWAAWLRNNYTA